MKKPDYVEQIRAFNRFYTSKLGILDTEFLESGFSLIEGRIIYEIGSSDVIARDLTKIISIDEGYLSRIIAKFERNGIINRVPSVQDKRKRVLRLTAQGSRVFHDLNHRADGQIEVLIAELSPHEKIKLTKAIKTVQELLHR